jgi:hypothetical protein
VDLAVVIRGRLEQLSIDQCELAAASEVTESYISQLLSLLMFTGESWNTEKREPKCPLK